MSEPIYFLQLEIENYRCFKEKQVLDLSDGKGNWRKWTLILGDNGTGKSSLLELLAAAEMEEGKLSKEAEAYYSPKGYPFDESKAHSGEYPELFCKISLNIYWSPKNDYSEKIEYWLDYLSKDPSGMSIHYDKRLKELMCFGYGANRKMGTSSLAKSMNNNSETLFNDNARLINAEEWLLQLDYAASKDSEVKNFAIKKREQVRQILIDLLPGIDNIRFTVPTKGNLKSTVEFKTPFEWVTIHQLSLGYKTMVAWMVDLAARMFERYPNSDNPLAEPAIVLVDEIDLHLHPKWQRKIFDYLSDKFPQTQFIVTAHSPLVVQSAPEGANIVLLRKENDQVIIDTDLKSVQTWRVDQILTSDLFGLDSSRSIGTEKKLEERKSLLAKKNLSKEEKARLDELNALADRLPIAYNFEDIEAMSIVQEAAEYLRNKKNK